MLIDDRIYPVIPGPHQFPDVIELKIKKAYYCQSHHCHLLLLFVVIKLNKRKTVSSTSNKLVNKMYHLSVAQDAGFIKNGKFSMDFAELHKLQKVVRIGVCWSLLEHAGMISECEMDFVRMVCDILVVGHPKISQPQNYYRIHYKGS